MIKKNTVLIFTLFLCCSIFAQDYPTATPSYKKLEGWAKRKENETKSIFKNLEFRNIGPTVFSGRVVDLDVNPEDPTQFYVAFASGGLWRTRNNGTSFEPLFQDQAAMTIGDIKVDWQNGETVWIGTGESNAFLFPGIGVFKSVDTAKTWQYMGLGESHSISRIVIHPENSDVVWAAATGHLYTSNPERGVYKSVDGGKTWTKTLFVNDSTAVTELIIDPLNSEFLYAATWERYRRPWKRHKSGEGSGIYKSMDGGETWNLLTTKESGFPVGKGVGRIGLTVYPKNPQILYAMLDNQFHKKDKDKESDEGKLTKDQLKEMSKDDFLELEKKLVSDYLTENHFPEKYNADTVMEMVKSGKIKPVALVEYLEDANSAMFQGLKIIGAEVYRSDDAGKTWKKTHEKPIDNLIYTYGYVFDVIRIDPNNPDKFYIGGVPLLKSEDGGKTFSSINGDNVHVDHHALWINPNKSGHLINGNDGGVNMSYDDGITWFKLNSMEVGQVYSLNYDMEEPYNVYAGFQDNGVWKGSSEYNRSNGWHSTGQYPYESIMGGDGFQIQVDFRDNNTVYTGYQYGNYYRINIDDEDYKYLTVKHELGERPLRFNWETPIHLSRHNQDIFYIGSNKLYRSLDKGETFEAISGDLTNGGKVGDVPYGTLTAIHESPLKFGLLYSGSDDGLIHVSRDGGFSWENISDGLPTFYQASSIQASKHYEGRVYISFTGYKFDNSKPHIYKSDDFGKTWSYLGETLPYEAINVVYEDPVNENLIYVGTENGLYISVDQGKTFMPITTDQLPAVSVYDIEVHPRGNDLLVGTHGRSIYVTNLKELQHLSEELMNKELHVFDVDEVKHSSRWGTKRTLWSKPYTPAVEIPIYTKEGSSLEVTIKSENDLVLYSFKTEADAGLNYLKYSLNIDENKVEDYTDELNSDVEDEKEMELKKRDNDKYYLEKGTYKVVISNGNYEVEQKLVIK